MHPYAAGDRMEQNLMGSSAVSVAAETFCSAVDHMDEIFDQFPRIDQRRWARTYLDGLLRTTGRRTIEQVARTCDDAQRASNGLQQFINSSTWDWGPVREQIARVAARTLPREAWTVVVIPVHKKGRHSVGVHRRFVPQLGRSINCQLALGLFQSAGPNSTPVDWQLHLDPTWLHDEVRRRSVRIPAGHPPRTLARQIVELVGDLRERDGEALPVVIDLRAEADVSPLVAELAARRLDVVVEVGPAQRVFPGLPPTSAPRRRTAAASRRSTVEHLPGRPARRPGRPAVSVLPVTLTEDDDAAPVRLLEWREPGSGRARFWLTTIARPSAPEIVALALRSIDGALAALAGPDAELGMLDFEGRSYPGWHHHMTMVSLAHLRRLTGAVDCLPQGGNRSGAAALHLAAERECD